MAVRQEAALSSFSESVPWDDASKMRKLIAALVGYACYSAFEIGLVFTDLFALEAASTPLAFAMMRVAYVGGVVVSLVFGTFAPKQAHRLFPNRVVLGVSLAVIFVIPVLSVVEMLVEEASFTLSIVAIGWFATGVAMAYAEKHMITAFSAPDIRVAELATIVKGVAAGVVVVADSFIVFPANVVVLALLPMASLFLVAPLSIRAAGRFDSELDRRTMMKRFDSPKSGILVMACSGLASGLIGCLLAIDLAPTGYAQSAFGSFAVFAAMLFSLFITARNEVLTIRAIHLFLLPVFIGCFVFSMLFEGVMQTVMYAVAFIATQSIRLVDVALNSNASKTLGVPATFCYSLAQMPIMGGVLVGWALGAVVSVSEGPATVMLDVYLGIVLVALAAVVVLDNERRRRIEKAGLREKAHEGRSTLEKKCDKLAAERGLTEREAEILTYLARGRNADYIAGTLYLARPTVKTHIHHVYDKVEVHNQQDLITLVEDMTL